MSDLVISYKGTDIVDVSASTTKTLKTEGKYCEDDIEVIYTKPAAPEPTIQSLTVNADGTYTAPSGVDGYSPITVNVGGGVTQEDLTFTTLDSAFKNNNWINILRKFKNSFVLNNITSFRLAFDWCNSITNELEGLNITTANSTVDCFSIFSGCSNLTKLPNLTGAFEILGSGATRWAMFTSCKKLTTAEIENFFARLTLTSNGTGLSLSTMFSTCGSIRDLTNILNIFCNACNGKALSDVSFSSMCNSMYTLNAITNFPASWDDTDKPKTSNAFPSTFDYCNRLRNILFETNNGVPYVKKWKSQTIDLTESVGYRRSDYRSFVEYGMSVNNNVFNSDSMTLEQAQERYNALKDTDDWYACTNQSLLVEGTTRPAAMLFSRYNHDSAAAAINSLPDCSAYLATAGGTNTIKFQGMAGYYTDGGPISALTAEEIQVATDKGWTVTIV